VPELARVMWTETAYEEILPLAEGKTTLAGGHVREGFVIRPLRERIVHGGQRVQLKMAGEGYLMRKTA
jgi:hypothetical protein